MNRVREGTFQMRDLEVHHLLAPRVFRLLESMHLRV